MLRPAEVPLDVTLAELRAVRNTSLDVNLDQLRVRAQDLDPPPNLRALHLFSPPCHVGT